MRATRSHGALWAGLTALLTTRLAMAQGVDVSLGTLCANEQAATAVVYRIDATTSRLDVLVRKGGMFGHNHVVSISQFDGCAVRDGESLAIDFQLAVKDLIVDLEQARQQAGEEFEDDVSTSAKTKTRGNMLGEYVLDADRHPAVRLHAGPIAYRTGQRMFPAQLSLTGTTRAISINAVVSEDSTPRATGSFIIDQSDFGIEPFSALGGIVRLADRLEIKFDLDFAAP